MQRLIPIHVPLPRGLVAHVDGLLNRRWFWRLGRRDQFAIVHMLDVWRQRRHATRWGCWERFAAFTEQDAVVLVETPPGVGVGLSGMGASHFSPPGLDRWSRQGTDYAKDGTSNAMIQCQEPQRAPGTMRTMYLTDWPNSQFRLDWPP